ncbi:MAG: Heme exporter protein A [Candidatus Tokpelaia hoelldobleri]|uniref:Heme exporter protein A n=1 Tax=Candidatus Tokpelaia hoelldobleri TaxID=1902579 RepID=A0A1U9JVF4_9HYPH|nr:MAG: Heme exporter protein A [Candidatus Tokpelaia hoelldoblerii]
MQLTGKNLAAQRGSMLLFSALDFRLSSGELATITGPNGIGKSTLLRILAGQGTKAAGTITLHEGETNLPLAPFSHYLGGKNAMKDTLSVMENLQFWASWLGARRKAAHSALDAVQLAHTGHLPFRVLSTGQKQRVAFARLLLAQRPLWLLDEPTSGLDEKARMLMTELLRQHLTSGGMIVAATHLPLGYRPDSTINLPEYAP